MRSLPVDDGIQPGAAQWQPQQEISVGVAAERTVEIETAKILIRNLFVVVAVTSLFRTEFHDVFSDCPCHRISEREVPVSNVEPAGVNECFIVAITVSGNAEDRGPARRLNLLLVDSLKSELFHNG